MMFGLLITSTNEGGIPDIVKDGETVFINVKQKLKQLADKIKWLIEHSKEVCLMSEKGQKYFLEQYTF
jgi:glycosyltransferase involved in cell wall biosynthesis